MSWPKGVRRSDLRIEFMRGSGKGGQNRNKRDTACRITHLPTGISARAEDCRTQELNKRAAFLRLAKKLTPLIRAAVGGMQFSKPTKRIRTYHFPRDEVIDHGSGTKYSLGQILDGNLEALHKAWLTKEQGECKE